MASEQMMSEAIAKAVAEANRVVLQTMAEAWVETTQNAVEPKLGSLHSIGKHQTSIVN